jgi:hypothetical protein
MGAAGPRKGTFPPFGSSQSDEPSFSPLCGRWAKWRSHADRVLPQTSESSIESRPVGRSRRAPAVSRQSPRLNPAAPKVHDAQLTIAREQGFPSWPRFRAFVIQSGLDDRGVAAAFIDAAVSDLRRAEEILAAHPQIAGAGFFVALVLENWQGSGARSETDAVARDRLRRPTKSRAAPLRLLLPFCQRKVEPGWRSASVIPEDCPDNPLSCLYAATGLNNNPALALALLEAGANPNDSESLYHSTEHRDLACLKLLLRHGATRLVRTLSNTCSIVRKPRGCGFCRQPAQIL